MPRRRFTPRHALTALIAAIVAALVTLARQHQPAAPPVALPSSARIARAIDGDTVELADGRHLRYIGIDTPETRRHEGNRWIEDPEPLAREAAAFNRSLVEGKTARLEYDAVPFHKYSRLLAYVYLPAADGRELMVNEELARQGYAQLLTIPPDVKYTERFRAAVQEARDAKRGLWGLPELPRRRARRRHGR